MNSTRSFIYDTILREGDIIRRIQEYHAYFPHYLTAGNPGRNDLDDSQEINYPPVFRAIAATSYEGYIAHEFIPKGDVLASLQAAYDLTRASVTD